MTPSIARHPARAIAHRLSLPLALLLVAVLVAACGMGAVGGSAPPGGGADGPAASSGSDLRGVGDEGTPPFADLAERKIVKTGEITLEVEAVATAVGQVRALALDLEGYVGGSSSGAGDEAATLTLRIPADRFDEALERLHELDATVKAEATREQDVTSTIVDLEARIRNLEASERQYRLLLDRAQKIEDVLSVQARLDDVRGQIEQLKAQLTELSGLANLATLTVTLVPASAPVEEAAEGWDPGATFDSALAALVSLGQAIGTGLIWLAIVGLPLAAVTLVVVAIVLRAGPAFRRRIPAKRAGE